MPKIVDKELKKMEILHAAMNVFARKGVVKTKMIDIANEAGIGKGTIYEYYRSKEKIFISAFTYFFENLESMLGKALENEDDPFRQLQIIVNTSFEALLHGGEGFADIMMDFWAEGVRNKDQEILIAINLKDIYSEYRKTIQLILKRGIRQGVFRKMDTKAAASVFLGSFDGIMLQWIIDRKEIDLNKVTKEILNTFINGISKK